MPRSSEPMKAPWLARAPAWQVIVVAFLSGFAIWISNAGLDVLAASHKGMTLRIMQTLDVCVGILVAVLIARILLGSRMRHQRVTRNLEIIAEMNHHIRNALQRMQYAAQISENEEIVNHIRESSSRIQWALQEVLPKSARGL